uniref:Tetratricopeptide repeat domain 7A n=1 Tax=Sinocyclocheilus grahami TaxID=75366 RepID=A0A672QC62_SINGR
SGDSLLLLAKVHYVQGHYRDAQGMCARAGVDDFSRHEKPVYQLRMLAEAFVIKGLSLDHQSMSGASRVRLSEREEECLSCYLMACDAGLLYLQELDKVCVCFTSCQGPVYSEHVFLCRHVSNCFLGVSRCLRRVMRAVESRGSQSFRKKVARRLAEVLLGSVCEEAYWGPLSPPPPGWLKREGATHPKNAIYPSGEAVISRTPEHQEARESSMQDASSVYDLLSIAMARRGQYAMLSECLERAMKFSYNEFHLWYQLGLSLMASGKNEGAVSVLKECVAMKPQDPIPPLLAAKVCINQLHWLEDAVSLSAGVVALGEGAGEFLPRAHLAIGLCRSLQASDATLKADRDEFNRRALQSLRKAHALDPGDPQISFYLSLQLALVRQVSEAMEPLQSALNIRGDDPHSLHLLTLLLSAQKHYQHALDTLKLAINQHPDNFNLLFTKVKLEEVLFGPAAALQTCAEMLQLWQSRYDLTRLSEEDDTSSIPPDPGPLSKKPSGLHLTLPDFQETETGSQSAPSLAVSRLEQAMSEVSAISSAHRHGPAYIWTTLEHIWLQAAGELFMADGRMKEAQFCVQEAGTLFPASHSVLLLKGRVAELRGNDTEAKSLYDEALAINPRGHQILLHLGKLLVRTGRVGLGEKMLRDAIQVENTAHEAWSGLGEALESRGSAQAPDCFLTALELESSCPIRPFTIIPREL